MKKYSVLLLSLLLVIVLVSLAGCKKQDTRTLRLGHGLSIDHPVHKGMEFMSKRVKELSDGKLQIKIYPSEQLGSERECLEMLQIGSLDMTKVSSAVMEGFVPEYKAFGLPYLFDNEEHFHRVVDGETGQKILNSGTEYWLKGLTFYDAGSRSFYTIDEPIKEPSDLEGKKIRVMQSIMSVKMINALGGSPTPISWGELYTSLQNQVVDGAENNLPSFHLSHHYEICNYYSMDQHTMLPDVLLMSTHTWKRLSEQEKKWINQATKESVKRQRKLWKEAQQEALNTIKEAGVEVIKPDKEPFREKVQNVYKFFEKENPEVYNIVQEIRAAGNSSGK